MAFRQSQKRSRSPDSCEECLPISKRINRLQIEGDRRVSDESQAAQEVSIQDQHQVHSIQSPQPSCVHQSMSINPCQGCLGNNNLPYDIAQGYNPELTRSDNPQYYNINNTLFKAHYDRTLRQKDQLQYPNS